MKANLFSLKMCAIIMVTVMSVCFSSCSKDDDKVTTPPDNNIHITNNSTYTLSRFTVIFWNDDKETITNKEYGTFSTGEEKEIPIPSGATQYYMATNMNSKWFVSPTYKISEFKTLKLSTDMVNVWTTSSSSPRLDDISE